MNKLSLVLATRNEEGNIGDCIKSVASIVDEIIVVDENSSDKTREIAQKFGAKVYEVPHEPIFHITKQKALDQASGEWILQMDADERVTHALGEEIKKIINLSDEERLFEFMAKSKSREYKLFRKHQEIIERRDGKIGKESDIIAAYYIPRRNYFLGKPLTYGGVYPDGVIRLLKKGKARFPARSVHEQIQVDGKVAWLTNDLLHYDSPTLRRYLVRLNRYTDLHAEELSRKKAPKNLAYLFYYSVILGIFVFLKLYIRHKGFLDGIRGFLWSAFSASHYPISYFKYWNKQ